MAQKKWEDTLRDSEVITTAHDYRVRQITQDKTRQDKTRKEQEQDDCLSPCISLEFFFFLFATLMLASAIE